jgi:hypothetical protein
LFCFRDSVNKERIEIIENGYEKDKEIDDKDATRHTKKTSSKKTKGTKSKRRDHTLESMPSQRTVFLLIKHIIPSCSTLPL